MTHDLVARVTCFLDGTVAAECSGGVPRFQIVWSNQGGCTRVTPLLVAPGAFGREHTLAAKLGVALVTRMTRDTPIWLFAAGALGIGHCFGDYEGGQ